jgi:transitional endoplasmic reticulum ATPase
MPYALRPHVEIVEHAGLRISLIDAEQIVTAARARRVELLHDPRLRPPVRRVDLHLDGASGAVADAVVQLGLGAVDREPRPGGVTVLGRDPLGLLLARRADAGEPWANRVIDGMSAVADQMTRRLGLGAPPGPEPEAAAPAADEVVATAEVVDDRIGLHAEVITRASADGGSRTIALHADAPELTVDFIRAVCRMLAGILAAESLDGGSLTVALDSPDETHVSLDQVGGLDDIVASLRQIAVSFRHPQTMARWGAQRPQGLLLYGPAGTGKTMLARALAREIGARFQEIHTPDILDKWLGASERNIKRIFRDARRYREPTVMLFDEFDTIIGYAGAGEDSASHAINSVAGIFKQEMNDLVDNNPEVIVVATTNFPERIDPSLVRSGRFDVKLLVPAPDQAARANILAKMIRGLIATHERPGFRMFADDLDIDAIAARSHGLTGADLREALRRAQLAKALEEARTATPASPINDADLTRSIDTLAAELAGKRA